MKLTDEQNEGNRMWLESAGAVLTRENQFGFNWYAVPQEAILEGKAPRMFAFSWKSPAQHLIGCSTEVPEEFRRYWAIHEFLEEPKDYKGRCVETLNEELELVSSGMKRNYVPIRAEFFRGLVDFARANNYSQEQVEEFTLSRDRLNELEKGL